MRRVLFFRFNLLFIRCVKVKKIASQNENRTFADRHACTGITALADHPLGLDGK